MTNAMISSEEAQSYQSKGLSPRRRTCLLYTSDNG